jgi:hypothetical protein
VPCGSVAAGRSVSRIGLLAACCGGTHARPEAHTPRQLVFLSRNYEYAVPEDVAVYADGSVRYRYLLHTKVNMKVRTTTLSPASLAALRRVLAHTDLRGAQRLGVDPPRGGYRYLLRIGGRMITTVDGHLTCGR